MTELIEAKTIRELPRSVISLIFVLNKMPNGATYEGLRIALGMFSDSGCRNLVKLGKRLGVVTVIQTGNNPHGGGRGAKAVIKISQHGDKLIKDLGIKQHE